MIEFVGFGVVMENVIEEFKEIVDYVIKFYEDDGVVRVIEKFVLGEVVNV